MPYNRQPTENELNRIVCGSFHNVISEIFLFFFLTFVVVLFYFCLCFKGFCPYKSLHIYYGSQFCVFMGFLSLQKSETLYLYSFLVPFLGLFYFWWFALSYSGVLLCFILSYYYLLAVCCFLRRDTKRLNSYLMECREEQQVLDEGETVIMV